MARFTARRTITLPSFNSVAAGARATVALPVGARKYQTLILQYKDGTPNQAAIEADLTNLRLLLNGKVQWELSVARLNLLNASNGLAFVAGHILIPLSAPWARTVPGEELFGWGTANVSNFSLEIDIAGTAVAPVLAGWSEIEDVVEPIGAIVKRRVYSSKTASGAGVMQITDLPRRDAFSRIHLFTVQATRVKVVADAVEFFDLTRAAAGILYAKQKIVAPANTFTVAFDATQQVTDLLPMTRNVPGLGVVPVQDFRLDVTMAAGATFDVLAETVGQPD